MVCADCFSGAERLGTPTGEMTTIHGIQTYVARPEDGVTPKGIVVFITDAFGIDFVNNKLLSDHYAKKGGFLVYRPDFMNDLYYSFPLPNTDLHLQTSNSMDVGAIAHNDKITKPTSWFDVIFYKPFYVNQALPMAILWLYKTRRAVCKPRIFEFFEALRTSPPPFPTNDLKIGAAGFCWSGLYTFLLAHNTPSSRVQRHSSQINSSSIEPLIDCGFATHTSNLAVPADVEAVKLPISVAIGHKDIAMGSPKILQMKDILENKLKGDNEVNIIPSAKHGFAVRTHPDDKFQNECCETSETQAVEWF